MTTLLGLVCLVLLILMSLLSGYQWVLAFIALFPSAPSLVTSSNKRAKFLVLIPAHNEETSLSYTLGSLAKLKYHKELVRVVVIADRCNDSTAVIARSNGADCLERFDGPSGKGAAIAWAIEELHNKSVPFDALVILDADTVVDDNLLEAFNEGVFSGHHVQQGYCYISNPWESPFTRIIAVTSILRNRFFYFPKSCVGATAMLVGTGMCFTKQILSQHGWNAFSVGEDWEFSTSLILAGQKIYFNSRAKVFQLESTGFKQASNQRLRWASGRYAVAAGSAWKLLRQGVRSRRPYLFDAAITLLAPNYSTQASLVILGFIGSWFLSDEHAWGFLLVWSLILAGSLAAFFVFGALFTGAPLRTLAGLPLIPFFLPWRMVIEILGLLGYGRKQWLRTPRLTTSRPNAEK